MKSVFTSSEACRGHTHCVACRTDLAWRESLQRAGLVDSAEFDCPCGVTEESAPAVQAEALAKLPGHDPEAAAKAKAELEEQGRAAWAWLHAEAEKGALTEDRITKEFEPMIPNYGCSCPAKWKVIRKPLTADQKQWAIDRHNDVNRELGKPIWEANTPP